MIKLYGFGPHLGMPDPSPHVLKVDLFMRMAGIEFEARSGVNNLRKAPKGKLPFIEDDGQVIADSFFIFRHLRARYGADIDAHLSPEQRSFAELTIKSLDENFYWCIVISRWLDDRSWPTIKQSFFSELPLPLKWIIPAIARRGVRSSARGHGIGLHSEDELREIAAHTLDNLSQLLGDKAFFFGDQPSTLDAVAYAMLAQLIVSDLDMPISQQARSYDNLVGFCERIRGRYYA